jgi:hypothetical protein
MPNSATPKRKDFARRLLIYEAATGTRVGANDSAVFRVCEKLRRSLAKLLGAGGFRSLLVRAQVLAGAEVSWLLELQVKADGSLDSVGELEAKLDTRAVTEGEAALVAHLLGLLVTFIGPALTLRLLQNIWPKMENLNF